jgi:hypothetical protein
VTGAVTRQVKAAVTQQVVVVGGETLQVIAAVIRLLEQVDIHIQPKLAKNLNFGTLGEFLHTGWYSVVLQSTLMLERTHSVTLLPAALVTLSVLFSFKSEKEPEWH